jgi:hypothetical protein
MSRPIFFIKRGDRLIARLKHLFYAWRFAQQVDGLVIMAWPDELPEFWHQFDGPMYSVSLIFDLREFYARGGADSVVFMGERKGTPPWRWDGPSLYDAEYEAMRFNRFPRDMFARDGLVFYEPRLMRFQLEDERKPSAVIQRELGVLFNRIPPTPPIQRAIEQARARLANSSYVGLHVRRGDTFEQLRRELPGFFDGATTRERVEFLMGHFLVRTAPFELYEPAVRRAIEEKKKIAYFSDSPETIDWFRKKFGATHFMDMSKLQLRIPIQKAFLDFAILKDSERIVSTRSNYASFGAELSGAERVIVSADDTAEMSLDDVAELYFETAMREFLPGVDAGSPRARDLRAAIRKAHLAANGMAEQVQPQPSVRDTTAGPIVTRLGAV